MRPIYLFFRITMLHPLVVFYKKRKTLNAQKTFNAQTIFVSNHPSAFLDPFIIGNLQLPIIFILTRGDVFKKWLQPITWSSHMVPIFRKEEDGADSIEKNKSIFLGVEKLLLKKKSILFFGEGYTDNVFIRSLKSIKKGPARIGFQTMVSCNWEEDIKVQPIAINYCDPKKVRSGVLLAFGKIFHLKDYKEIYDENPNKAITQITKEIEDELKNQLTYVHDKELAPFVENIMCITRKGMNHEYHDSGLSLEERYHYSKSLANKINDTYNEDNKPLLELKDDLQSYFSDEKTEGINDNWIVSFSKTMKKSILPRILYLILFFPIFIIGIIHCFLPYILVKKLVEKSFKRDVFWSGVKFFAGSILITVYNIPSIFLFYNFIYESYWAGILYFVTIPAISGVIAYNYFIKLKDTSRYLKTSVTQLSEYADRRSSLVEKIKELGL